MPLDEPTVPGQGHLGEERALQAALGEPVDAAHRAHLRGCAACRAEVAGWSRLAAARAADDVEPHPLPAGAWERIAQEAGLRDDGSRPAPVSTPDEPVTAPVTAAAPHRADRPGGAGRAPRARRWWPAVAAALVGIAAGVVGTRLASDGAPAPGPPAPAVVSSAVLQPVALPADPAPDTAPGGSAEVDDEDGSRRLHLTVHGVTPPPGGFLEAWLMDADGGLVSLGALGGTSATVALPPGLDLDRYDVVDVSAEPLDGDPGHSSDSVLRGTLTPT
ncbi:anti-sigma factor [Kineococcus sp. SYSU DK003]|uniref:anti-sigma factor n=1 Tax=Kineococcus sp. SYSU DK003 TaxID=3383124 RepID=UPI003D7CBD06